jgi:hypothetical protein
MRIYEFFHEPDARRVLEHPDVDAARPQPLLFAEKRLVLADDDGWDAV